MLCGDKNETKIYNPAAGRRPRKKVISILSGLVCSSGAHTSALGFMKSVRKMSIWRESARRRGRKMPLLSPQRCGDRQPAVEKCKRFIQRDACHRI